MWHMAYWLGRVGIPTGMHEMAFRGVAAGYGCGITYRHEHGRTQIGSRADLKVLLNLRKMRHAILMPPGISACSFLSMICDMGLYRL